MRWLMITAGHQHLDTHSPMRPEPRQVERFSFKESRDVRLPGNTATGRFQWNRYAALLGAVEMKKICLRLFRLLFDIWRSIFDYASPGLKLSLTALLCKLCKLSAARLAITRQAAILIN